MIPQIKASTHRAVRAATRDAENRDSETMTVMSRRDGLTDMAERADEIAAC